MRKNLVYLAVLMMANVFFRWIPFICCVVHPTRAIVLCCILLCGFWLCCVVLSCIVLYCVVFCCVVLSCVVLYCAVLCYNVLCAVITTHRHNWVDIDEPSRRSFGFVGPSNDWPNLQLRLSDKVNDLLCIAFSWKRKKNNWKNSAPC